MLKYYGYTCTTSVKYNREDKEARKKTKQYQLLVSKCSQQQIILEEIYSDLLSDFYKTREELGKLCQIVEYAVGLGCCSVPWRAFEGPSDHGSA